MGYKIVINVLDSQIDVIFELVDILCWEQQWEAINCILIYVMANKDWDLTLLISFLTITASIKQELPDRPAFYDYVFTVAKERCGGGDKMAQNLLEGLE